MTKTVLMNLILTQMQDGDANEIQKKVMFCFRMMSRCFIDPAKAEESFQILDQLKDANVWKILRTLLDPNTTSSQASNSRVRKQFLVCFNPLFIFSLRLPFQESRDQTS